jgi:hypothetical protein
MCRMSVIEPSPDSRPAFARLGACALATALLAAIGAIFIADDREMTAVFEATALVLFSLAVVLTGPPFASPGKPSIFRILTLFAAGIVALALMFARGDVLVIAFALLQVVVRLAFAYAGRTLS